jgi:hypothetical protein
MHSLRQAILKVIDDKQEQQGSSDRSLGHPFTHHPGPVVSPVEANPCLSIAQESLDPPYITDLDSLLNIVAKRSVHQTLSYAFEKSRSVRTVQFAGFFA